jgi:TrkA-N domain/Ion channel
MEKKSILILGSGHLSFRVKKYLTSSGFKVEHNTIDVIHTQVEPGSFLENINTYLGKIDMRTVAMIYLLDEKDENNLQLIIAIVSLKPDMPITASLFNENLIPHLQSVNNNLTILNPAKIAAPVFVAAIYQNIKRRSLQLPADNKLENKGKPRWNDLLIQKLLFSFIGLLVLAVFFFHFIEKLTWVNSLYFVVVTVSTVGYGDINLLNSSSVSKIFSVILILSSTFFIWMIFSLTIDRILKKRIQLALGRKKYNFSNHIIVCGLGRLGYFIVEELLQKNEKVIIIEQNEDSRHIDYFRHLGAEVYIGDGRLSKVLSDINISKAKALISVINNDSVNLEIGLNARSYHPGMRLILRIFDEEMAKKINEYFNIHFTLSTSAIADEKFYEVLKS